MCCRMRVLWSFIGQISFQGKLLTLSATLSLNNPSLDNWFSFLIKYSIADSSNWRKINAKAESEIQSEIEEIRLVLKNWNSLDYQ